MWSEKVAAVASLGLVPAYRWLRQWRAQQTRQGAEREAYKPGAPAQAQPGAVRKGGAAAGNVPDGLARRGAMQAEGFAPGEPMARPAVESERVEFQPKQGKGEELPILTAGWPLL